MTVHLFVTCLIDQFFPRVGLSSARILRKLGVDVRFDARQTCCGQPAFNTGYRDEARQVAGAFLEVFSGCERIVVPSGSCAAMIRVFMPELFDEGSRERKLAEEISARTFELSEFLVDVLEVESTGARFEEAVTYHDSCHLLRELGVEEAPRRLISSVDGIDFREMKRPDRCCGFGGTFSVKFPELSAELGRDKIESIVDSGARCVVASDVGCLMHLEGLIRRRQLPVRTMHLAELLACFDDQT